MVGNRGRALFVFPFKILAAYDNLMVPRKGSDNSTVSNENFTLAASNLLAISSTAPIRYSKNITTPGSTGLFDCEQRTKTGRFCNLRKSNGIKIALVRCLMGKTQPRTSQFEFVQPWDYLLAFGKACFWP